MLATYTDKEAIMGNEIVGSFFVVAVFAAIALAVAWCLVPLILLGTNRRLSRLLEQQSTANQALEQLLKEQRKHSASPP